MSKWIIGVDAGGTKCKASLFNAAGDEIASSTTGPANLFSDFQGAIASIMLACEQVLLASGHHIKPEQCALSIGAAGASVGSVQKKMQAWQHPFASMQIHSDLHISCIAANDTQPCVMIIVGTGSSVAIFNNNEVAQFGGHGFLLGDEASGAWLGRKAVQWYLHMLEQLIPNTEKVQNHALERALAKVLGNDIDAIIEMYGKANAATFASLVPTLLACHEQSANVQEWVEQGARYFASIIRHHANDLPIFIDGGLAGLYTPILTKMLTRSAGVPKKSATYGAYLCVNKPETLSQKFA